MMRSLYSGVSGLQNHQTRMDVIGNNISNVNTNGFKKGRVNFQDILSQTLTGAARPTDEKGGVNPKQVGLGMTIAAIDTIHNQGAVQTTGVNTDLAILGEGFFIEKVGNETLFSRNGSFGIDADGYLVNPANGYKVQGYAATLNADGTSSIDKQSGLQDLVIPVGSKDPAKATSIVKYKSNLNTLTPVIGANPTPKDLQIGTVSTTIDVYDSRGNKQQLRTDFAKRIVNGAEVPNEWIATVSVIDKQGRPVTDLQVGTDPQNITAGSNQFVVGFNQAGSLQSISDTAAGAAAVGQGNGEALEITLQYNVAGSEPMDVRLNLGSSGRFDGITQYEGESSTKAYFSDGMSMGYLSSFKIDDSGEITGIYSNGSTNSLGQIALATFTNPAGLEKAGESYFTQTNNSGMALFDAPGDRVAGSVKAGTLEMSNVDLAEEFTSMIVTQRGFQSNSRTITTSDEMLRELLNLKR